jgi:hypothetical protein
MNKNFNFIFKEKKFYKVVLYLLIFIVIIFSVYFSIPKFFNYTPKLIQESLRKNSDISVRDISSIQYKFFPSPRLSLSGSNLVFKENVLQVVSAEIDIILNPLNIINYKKIDYRKLLIKEGSTKIEIDKVNQLFNYVKKNQKKINFKKNIIILSQEKKKLFEINNSLININFKKNSQLIVVKGVFLNHKISFLIENKSRNKTNIILKIPELDISLNALLENNDEFRTFEGLFNLEVLNNIFQFNLIKDKNLILKNGFMRSNLINSSFMGEIFFKPYFFFDLDIQPSTLNIEKSIFKIQKFLFSNDPRGFEIIKKINGSLNFKDMFEGSIIFKNKEILFQNFKVGKDTSIFLNGKISELGKKGKIKFNLVTNVKKKGSSLKKLKINGSVIPFSSEIIFDQIVFDNEIFTGKKTKKYEEKFKNEVVNSSLNNIFNNTKINNFFKIFIN